MSATGPNLPEAGGSYIREPDGTLRPAGAPVKPTVKGPVKSPLKES